jgi:shikimate kinase
MSKFIILVGLTGSGKTTLGRKLAKTLEVDFYDTDEIIEDETKSTVSEIFRDQGEAAFREMEFRGIHKIFRVEKTFGFLDGDRKIAGVIATGGGLPIIEGIMDDLMENGLVVYLNLSLEEIMERLESAWKSRPLLSENDGLQWKEKLKELKEAREPIYRNAHLTIFESEGAEIKIMSYLEDLGWL